MSHQQPANDLFTDDTELVRRLGLTEALSIVISRIIGSGIFRTPGPMMAAVASVSLFYGSWIIGGIATILGAMLYAELVAMMPRSGGPYAYLKAAYPPYWTFLRGWAMFFVSETASIVAVSIVFAEYGNTLFETLTGAPYSHETKIFIAFLLIWGLTFSNLFGVGFSGILQNIFSFIKVGALVFIAVLSFTSSTGRWSNFASPFWPDSFNLESIIAIFAALRYGFFAYSGWEGATYVAEEVKNPRKNLPLSLFLGIGGVMALYVVVTAAYIYQLSVSEIIESGKKIAGVSMVHAAGVFGGVVISLAVMASTFGNVSTQILVKARTWYAMARDGFFFPYLSRVSDRYKTPNRALLAQAFWATVLLLFAASAGNTYETIIDFFSFTSSIFNISTFLAVPVLRKKYPDVYRPYRTWGYPFTLYIVLFIYVVFALVTLYDAFIPSLFGILLTTSGLIYYMKYRDRMKAD